MDGSDLWRGPAISLRLRYLSEMSPLLRLCLVLLCCLCLLPACRHRARKVETSLYFGMSMKDSGEVTDSAWQLFVQEEVLPVFPQGFTLIPAQGAWQDGGRPVSERSVVIVSVNELDEPLSKKIDSLRERYKTAFSQESVMRVDQPVARWDY